MRDLQGNGVFAISSVCHRRRRIAASGGTLHVETKGDLSPMELISRLSLARRLPEPLVVRSELLGNFTGGVLEPIDGRLSILTYLDEVAVRITHVASPFRAVIV